MNNMKNISLRSQWTNMISGNKVDENIVRPIVYDSWKRCLSFNLNPYDLNEENILSENELYNYVHCVDSHFHENLSRMFMDIATDMKLSILLYDSNCKLNCIIAVAEELKTNIPKDLSENIFGTNAVCLALEHDTAIQLLSAEHFCFTEANCSAAPIHNSNGKVDYVINIGGFSKIHTLETLGLVKSIAQIIENNIRIDYMLTELSKSNAILNNIIENNSSAIVYIDDSNNIRYNRTFLNMLEINNTNDSKLVFYNFQKILFQIDAYKNNEDIDSKEIVLNINNRLKSYLVSMKQIRISGMLEKGYLFSFDDTNKLLKIKLKRNCTVYNFEDIVGENSEIRKVVNMSKRAARTSSAVLIHGESGTGKELFAQSIHNESYRKDKPFIAINCGAIPSELIESELFGYEPGAFTGASKSTKIGMLEAASEGTIFFDEVESMPLNVQVKLLRALSENKINRIGGIDEIPIDVRIISATKNDLLVEAEKGNFREDLYFRINVISIYLPPLRERKDDIPLLAQKFIDYFLKQSNISDMQADEEFLEALTYYYWRGNVRELKNVIEKAVLLNDDNKLTVKNLPSKIINSYSYKSLKEKVENKINYKEKQINVLKTSEEMTIEFVLKEENYNLTKSAKRLGISRTTLYKKIKEMPKLKKCKDIEQFEKV